MVTAIDDEDCMRIFRLFNEPEGKSYLKSIGIDPELVEQLELLGISCIANLLSSIKVAKYYEMTGEDVIITLATDSAEMYTSRLEELNSEKGTYTTLQAARDMEKCLFGQTTDHLKELNYYDRKAIHNLKYFTWIEQQEKDLEDLNQLWNDRDVWDQQFQQAERWDEMINEFNGETGVLKRM
jgi:hypothetical protein